MTDASDSRVALAACQALAETAQVPDTITVSVLEGRVTLGGFAQWAHERLAAGRVVGPVTGVRSVANEVRLRPASLDPALTSAIHVGLMQQADLASNHLDASMDAAGRVQLQGRVASWAARRRAERVCWATPGVTAVANHLEIAPDTS
jgi:osmotically-inducible protein OsmY